MTGPIAFDARAVQDHFPGIARYAFNLILALAAVTPERQFEILAPPTSGNTRFDLSPLRMKANVSMTELPVPLFSPLGQLRVPRWLGGIRAALYHSPYYLMPYWTPCPAIVTIHDLIPLLFPQYFTPFQRLVFAVTVRLAVRTARCVIVDSEATARDVRHYLGVSAERVVVVHAAADPTLVPASVEERGAVRARYGLPDTFVLYLGSNKPHKNLVRLVHSFAQLPARKEAPLVVAGHWDATHPEARHAAETLDVSGSIRWLGPVPQSDVRALYSAATIFVFPSEYEGFGLPVLEAMACGTPVICSTASSLPEVAGNAALMLDARHVDGWSHAMAQLLANDMRREELSAAGLRRAALFSWEAAARQVLAVYRAVER